MKRRILRRLKKKYQAVILVALIGVFLGGYEGFKGFDSLIGVIGGTQKSTESRSSNTNTNAEAGELYTVVKVADGDTFTIETGEKVRLIGVDTPESVSPSAAKNVPFGKEVSEYVKEQLLDKQVRLEFDTQRADRYGRLLAYVYLEDGTFLNELLVEKGYARVMTVPPNVAYQEVFLKAEEGAKESGTGVWKDYANIFPE